MDDPTLLKVVNGFYELVHNERDLPLLKLVRLNMFEEFPSIYLLHDDIHNALVLEGLLHLNNIRMLDELDNLDLFPQEILLSISQAGLVDLLHSNDLIRFPTLALIDDGELAVPELAPLDVLFFEAEVIRKLL
eukprot:CAMPEP_0170481026 /NCGR_PEP_ID=MMETSP0208-20121228/1627_1 /TAXON_ID=197538 /ORGANISM="Strombidium inclinatum, Strain S3" /LENGTH=132 /DNA_ID=CAMNT_0010753657 /DNA_START=1826 /DNA_END=2224 /DNA_ORIENTATION=-